MAFSAAGLAAGMKRSSICQPRTASGGVAFGGLSLSSPSLQFAPPLTVANAVSRSCESRNPDLLYFLRRFPLPPASSDVSRHLKADVLGARLNQGGRRLSVFVDMRVERTGHVHRAQGALR